MKYLSVFGIVSATFTTLANAGPVADQRFQDITEQTFRPIIEEYDLPGLAIGVTLGGQQHVFTTGMADQARAVPVEPDTIFELGSISKLFNVTLAALAEEMDMLSLDAAVSQAIPELEGSAFDQITLEDLAAHANGGLPLQIPSSIANEADLKQWLTKWNPPTNPKTIRSYSNVSIGLLGQIVGDMFCGSYKIAIEDYLLPALGLENTFIIVPDASLTEYAFGYANRSNSPIRVNSGLLDAEAYGLKSSVNDMLHFLDAHLGHANITPKISAALARTRVASYDTAYYSQAMIWEEYSWPVNLAQLEAGNGSDMILKPQPITRLNGAMTDPAFLNKTGSTNGFGAYVAMVPSEDIGVVVLTNRRYPNVVRAKATLELIEALLAEQHD